MRIGLAVLTLAISAAWSLVNPVGVVAQSADALADLWLGLTPEQGYDVRTLQAAITAGTSQRANIAIVKCLAFADCEYFTTDRLFGSGIWNYNATR